MVFPQQNNLIQFNYIYIASVSIKIPLRCLKKPREEKRTEQNRTKQNRKNKTRIKPSFGLIDNCEVVEFSGIFLSLIGQYETYFNLINSNIRLKKVKKKENGFNQYLSLAWSFSLPMEVTTRVIMEEEDKVSLSDQGMRPENENYRCDE